MIRARAEIGFVDLGVEAPGPQGATRAHDRRYVTEEQRSGTGCIGVQNTKVISARALRAVLGRLTSFFVALLGRTWRVRVDGVWREPALLRVWHGDLLTLAGVFRGSRATVLASKSLDGEWAACAARRLGYRVLRGSSSRGGAAAVRGILRQLDSGASVVIPADGPRGPARQEKRGLAAIAKLASASLIRVEVCARPSLRLPTWDAQQIPLPFARIEVRLS